MMVMMVIIIIIGPIPTRGGGGVNRLVRRKRLDIGEIGWREHVQRG